MSIKFYSPKRSYGCFSNFSKHEVFLDGKIWPTSEHYYQAKKFLDEDLQEQVRSCSGPGLAADMGRDRSLPLRQDWEEVKDGVMKEVLLAKFTQHADIKKILIDTGDNWLIEDSPIDYYWGCGEDGTGKNMLGRLLMEVRAIIFSL